jgi:hypothetical protein
MSQKANNGSRLFPIRSPPRSKYQRQRSPRGGGSRSSLRHSGLAHAVIDMLAPGEVSRIVTRWADAVINGPWVALERGPFIPQQRTCKASGGMSVCAKFGSERIHSIISSARTKSVGGRERDSALAAQTFTTSSVFVICCTGRSAGFSPFSMRTA